VSGAAPGAEDSDVETIEATLTECAYCGAEDVEDVDPRAIRGDAAAWARLAARHRADCEWIATRAHTREACCYEGCAREATTVDADGDAACERHAAQSHEYVVVTHLDAVGDWLAAEQVPAVVAAVAAQGWAVEIRAPRRGEAEGTYQRHADGRYQLLGGSVPQPEGLSLALDAAADATR
jgi:hypothetical protein